MAKQVGIDIGNYVFDATAKTITFSGINLTDIKQIKPIVNGTTGEVIFNPAEANKFGYFAGNVLTLEFNTAENGDDTDELYIFVNAKASLFHANNNSSTTPLGSGSTFTGTGDLVEEPDVMVVCKTDNTGTLFFDFSPDGVNWDSTFPVNGFKIKSGINEFHTAVKGQRYFRVRLVNDTGAQSYLRLYTYYGNFRQGNLPINQVISDDADAIVVRTVNSELDLAFGRFSGMIEDNKFGYIENLANTIVRGTPSTWVDVWSYGGQRTSPTTSFTPYMASDDVADVDIDFTWVYLDENGDRQTVTVSTDGADGRTPVSLGVTATEVIRGYNNDSTQQVGNVSVMTESDFSSGVPQTQSKVLANILAEDNQTQLCADRVPANKQRRITNISLSILRDTGAETSVQAVFQTRKQGKLWRTRRPIFVSNSAPYNKKQAGLILEAGEDYRVRIRDVSDSSTWVEADVDYQDVDI